ncbi:MAG: DUF5320 domain-containing protein [Candidatus Cloacimonetes bacterium]|nr:DUF5320 domain-containing protein [Candidatus Cloacimonadota bacterium]
MPRGDSRGPSGMGPMTGRGLGYCNDHDNPGNVNYVQSGGAGFRRSFGLSFGRGFGYGRGYGNLRFANYPNNQIPQYSTKDEEKYLKSEIDTLRNELETMETRLSELKKDE